MGFEQSYRSYRNTTQKDRSSLEGRLGVQHQQHSTLISSVCICCS